MKLSSDELIPYLIRQTAEAGQHPATQEALTAAELLKAALFDNRGVIVGLLATTLQEELAIGRILRGHKKSECTCRYCLLPRTSLTQEAQ